MRSLTFAIIAIVLIINNPVSGIVSVEQNVLGEYNLLIIAAQWEYKVFDLVSTNMTVEEILNSYNNSSRNYSVNMLEEDEIGVLANTTMNIHLVSTDVQHGLRIEELGFELISERPRGDQIFAAPTTGLLQFPDRTDIIKTEPRGSVGLGLENMEIIFNIKKAETSTKVFRISFNSNFVVFGGMAFLLSIKIKKRHIITNF